MQKIPKKINSVIYGISEMGEKRNNRTQPDYEHTKAGEYNISVEVSDDKKAISKSGLFQYMPEMKRRW